MSKNYFPFESARYVRETYPEQELFYASNMRKAFTDGCRKGSENSLGCWMQLAQKPKAMPNQYVFVLCFSHDEGVNITKVLSSEYGDFIEAHADAMYWCYEYRIAPRKIRMQFQELRDAE